MGEPSPSLAKIQGMNAAELTAQIDALATEANHVSQRIQRLAAVKPPPEEQVRKLTTLLKRLTGLENIARDRLRTRK